MRMLKKMLKYIWNRCRICKKKWKTFKGAPWWLVIKLTALCCTIFTAPFIYNALHTKKESVTITLAQ